MLKTRILVVDDEPVVREFFAAVLTRSGFEFIIAGDGEEGLRLFEEHFNELDLVILDVSMPKMNGVDLARRMFQLKPHPNVILMTGHNPHLLVPEDLQKLCGLLMKPFTRKQVTEAIEKCLKVESENHPGADL
jgi:two-component system cell cycle sensor histidine kinase/response regulator CckA